MAWTTPKTWASGYVVLAADLNTHLRDNLNVTAPAVLTTAGDIIYASGANTPARLAKSTTSTQYLANTGTSNVPAWNEVALATGVSGTLPVGNGGTGATSLTANGALIGNTTSAVTSVDMSTKGGILAGDGSGNPSVLAVGGSNDLVLTVDSGETTGMKWASAGGNSRVENLKDFVEGGVNSMFMRMGNAPRTLPSSAGDTIGDLEVGASDGTLAGSELLVGGIKITAHTSNGQYALVTGSALFSSGDMTVICRCVPNAPGSNQDGTFFGLQPATAGGPRGADSIGFRWTTADASIIGFVDSGGTETTRDSGEDADGTEYTLRLEVSANRSIVKFFIDNVQIGANVTTNIPNVSTLAVVINLAADNSGTAWTDHFTDVMAWGEVT